MEILPITSLIFLLEQSKVVKELVFAVFFKAWMVFLSEISFQLSSNMQTRRVLTSQTMIEETSKTSLMISIRT